MAIAATPMSMNLSAIMPALQQVTAALQTLVTTLQAQAAGGAPAAGAAALGGGPAAKAAGGGGCSCSGASDAVAGSSGIGDAPPPSGKSGGGASAAPAPPKASDDPKQSKKTDTPKKADAPERSAPTSNANASKGQQLADFAKKQLGKPYVYAAAGPDKFDCSGLTSFVAKHFGITIPRTASQQAKAGKAVDKKDLQAGDLVYFQNSGESSIGHIGMYLGDGKYIHAPQPGENVKIGSLTDSYASKTYRGARRIV